jgi:PAS domain S-box-containing protein
VVDEPRELSPPLPLVLVVEPNLEMTRYITASLADRYRVAAARDGSEGFDKARALKPDLILAETVLPRMSASELVRALRKLTVLDSTPVMLLTGQPDEELQMHLPESHAQDYLAKPFAPEELRLRVQHLLATKTVRATPALSPSEALFSQIYSVSADAIISIDERHRITMFNEGARSIFGYSAQEIVGSPLDRLIPERFRAAHRQHMERFSAGPQTARHMGSRSTRIHGLRKNGEEFPLDAAISKLELAGRRLLTVSLRDISEQQRSEDEQRLLAETGEILVSAGSDLQRLVTDIAQVIVCNIADWCAVDIVEAGASGRLKIVHSDPDKAALCAALEHYPADRERPNFISEAIRTRRPRLVNGPSDGDLESLAENAEHLRLLQAFDLGSFIVLPLIARGHPLGALAFGSARASRRYGARDVRKAEQLASRVAMAVDNARLHEALERAIQARDHVLGIVAHDLRNPLNAIVLRAHTLRRGRDPPERRDQRATDSIIRSAMSMHRLIEDLLDVTRLEAGHDLSMDRETVATSSILDEIVERQQAASSASHRELRIDADGAPASVWADRRRLLQIFDNLVGNAMKFSRSHITVGASTRENEALFWVADDGPGVSAEDLPRLFDRFWQASKTDRRGAGLGLSIVRGIVHAHGGRVWAERKVDAGATFYFTLPLQPPPDTQATASSPSGREE